MTLTSIPGGLSTIQEPDWTRAYDDALEQESAHAHWLAVVAEMKAAETLSRVNCHAIVRLIAAYLAFDRANRAVADAGAITRRGRKSPSWMVCKQAAELAAQLETELGLSPRRRNEVSKARNRPKKRTAADDYLTPRGDPA